MKKSLYLFIFFILLFTLGIRIPSASAHVLKLDGSIGVLLHIDPNDDPVAGQPAKLFFTVTDRDAAFNLSNCNCAFSIKQNDRTIDSHLLGQSSDMHISGNTVSYPYVFPEAGVYTLVVQGSSTSSSKGQSFIVTYDVRAELSSTASTSTVQQVLAGHEAHIIFFGAAIVICLIIIIRDRKKVV